jgi:hypothetical protein
MPDLTAGLCRNRPAEFNDITTAHDAHRAAEVCHGGCPVLDACRDWGIRHERHGVWGGLAGRALTVARHRLGIDLEEVRSSEPAPRDYSKWRRP